MVPGGARTKASEMQRSSDKGKRVSEASRDKEDKCEKLSEVFC